MTSEAAAPDSGDLESAAPGESHGGGGAAALPTDGLDSAAGGVMRGLGPAADDSDDLDSAAPAESRGRRSAVTTRPAVADGCADRTDGGAGAVERAIKFGAGTARAAAESGLLFNWRRLMKADVQRRSLK